MPDHIRPVPAVGDAAIAAPRAVPPAYPASIVGGTQRGERGDLRGEPRQQRQRDQTALRPGAPADIVDLTLDPSTVRKLPPSYYLKFLVDATSGDVVVQVIEGATDKVVRQVPNRDLRNVLSELTQ